MKKLMMMFAVAAAILVTGCTATKIEYEKEADGRVEYKIWHNDHWLKRDTGAMSGGMSEDGKFEVKLENSAASPSEEFNRTMQTYTSAFIQLAQIAAAAYNPSSSGIMAKSADTAKPTTTVVNVQPAAEAKADAATTQDAASTQKAEECADGSCPDGACTDGACKP